MQKSREFEPPMASETLEAPPVSQFENITCSQRDDCETPELNTLPLAAEEKYRADIGPTDPT